MTVFNLIVRREQLRVVTGVHLPVGITDQDHLLQQFSIRSGFGYDLPEDQQKFFDGVVLKWKHKADDGHQETRQLLAIQDHDDNLLQSLCLGFYLSLFCSHKHKAVKMVLQHAHMLQRDFTLFLAAFFIT